MLSRTRGVGEPLDKSYSAYGVGCTEVEVDVLTGQREILRSDILYDCGERLVSSSSASRRS